MHIHQEENRQSGEHFITLYHGASEPTKEWVAVIGELLGRRLAFHELSPDDIRRAPGRSFRDWIAAHADSFAGG
jgi:hypothetical protein